MTAARDEILLEKPSREAVEKHLRACVTDPTLKGLYRGAVQDPGHVHQAAKALVAHSVEQSVLHLFIGQVIQALQHQDLHHSLIRVERRSALPTLRAQGNPINLRRQHRNDVHPNLNRLVAQRVDFCGEGEQAGLPQLREQHLRLTILSPHQLRNSLFC